MTIGWRIQMFRNGRGDVLNEKILTTLHSHLTLFHPCIDAIVNTINWIFSFDPHSILYNQSLYKYIFTRLYSLFSSFCLPGIKFSFFFFSIIMKISFHRIWSTLLRFNDTKIGEKKKYSRNNYLRIRIITNLHRKHNRKFANKRKKGRRKMLITIHVRNTKNV